MNQAKKLEIWKEIIASFEDGDPSHSYRLFSETIENCINSKLSDEYRTMRDPESLDYIEFTPSEIRRLIMAMKHFDKRTLVFGGDEFNESLINKLEVVWLNLFPENKKILFAVKNMDESVSGGEE